jgi:hypothetical protein
MHLPSLTPSPHQKSSMTSWMEGRGGPTPNQFAIYQNRSLAVVGYGRCAGRHKLAYRPLNWRPAE